MTIRDVLKKKVMIGLTLGIIFASSLSLTSVMHRDIISVHVPIGCRKIQSYCKSIIVKTSLNQVVVLSGVFMLYEIRRY